MRQGTGDEFRPHVVLLYCEHCMAEGVAAISMSPKSDGFSVKMEMLPCSSKIEPSHVLKIIEGGADGVEVVTCPVGVCQFLDGNIRAEKRIEYTRKFLVEIGMGADRLGMSRGTGLTLKDLTEIAGKRAQAAAPLGINPMKGGNTR
jgi:F420-non-reducing hydrogenase iron-sulfur subunit